MPFRTASSRIYSSTRRLKSLSAQFPRPSSLTPSAGFTRTMSSLPKTMFGVTIEKTGGTDVLQWKSDLPLPTPKEGEILVKNEVTGINYIDTFVSTSSLLAKEGELTR